MSETGTTLENAFKGLIRRIVKEEVGVLKADFQEQR